MIKSDYFNKKWFLLFGFVFALMICFNFFMVWNFFYGSFFSKVGYVSIDAISVCEKFKLIDKENNLLIQNHVDNMLKTVDQKNEKEIAVMKEEFDRILNDLDNKKNDEKRILLRKAIDKVSNDKNMIIFVSDSLIISNSFDVTEAVLKEI